MSTLCQSLTFKPQTCITSTSSKSFTYDINQIAIIPMGFCYPGTGPSGDLPPRKECASLWLAKLLAGLPNIQLTLLIGQYAQQHYLGKQAKTNLTKPSLLSQIIYPPIFHYHIHHHAIIFG
jgi:hypothetical protein